LEGETFVNGKKNGGQHKWVPFCHNMLHLWVAYGEDSFQIQSVSVNIFNEQLQMANKG
jgi:hypothetical protein